MSSTISCFDGSPRRRGLLDGPDRVRDEEHRDRDDRQERNDCRGPGKAGTPTRDRREPRPRPLEEARDEQGDGSGQERERR
jgi:hypothetical protein